LQDDIVKHIRPTLIVLFAAVCFVLLIACANLANLMLTRSLGREREVAIRLALGANRSRIIRQMLTESVLLSTLGGIAGLMLAWFGTRLLVAIQPANLPRLDAIAIDYRVFAFCTILCIFTPILFGLAPALHGSRANLAEVLKRGGRGSSQGGHKLRNILVVVEIALSLVLLIGGGLLIRTFVSLQQVHLGYDPDNVLTFRVSLPFTRYRRFGPDRNAEFFRQLEERISNIPGIEAAGAAIQLPLTQGGFQTGYAYDEETEQRLASFNADWRYVTPGYFTTMRTRLIAGRFFTEQDNIDNPPVAIVDDLMARKIWPNESAIGKHLKDEGPDRHWKEIVGVVEHMSNNSLTTDVREQIYVSQRQMGNSALSFVVRTKGSANGVMKSIEQEVHRLDADLAIQDVHPMSEYVSNAMAQTRYSLILIGLLAAAAMLLAGVGLYGVISYNVTQRTQEIGIRVALGGQQSDILKLIMGHGMILTGIGIGSGLVAAAVLTQLMAGILYGVSPNDPATFAGISILLILVTMLAVYVPARRAARVNPITALRYE
jgi:putative ABC transport system permease protein